MWYKYRQHCKFHPLVLACAFSVMFTGCSLTEGHNAYLEPQPFSKLTETSEWYEDQLSASVPEYNFDWQILLARAYSAEGDTNRAFEVIRQMRENAITPLHGNYADLIEAQVRSGTGNYSQALSLLNSIDAMNLPEGALAYYYALKGKVLNRAGNYAAAGECYLNLAHAVKASDKKTAWKKALQEYRQADNKEILAQFKSSQSNEDRGFLEYALIQKSPSEAARSRLMSRFTAKYPNHPVFTLNAPDAEDGREAIPAGGPDSSQGSVPAGITRGDTIAVFLPLTGRYSALIGQPVRMGIENAFRDRGIAVNLKFYDTAAGSVSDFYADAMASGAKAIIGPIIKNEVDELLSFNPQVPVIALNEGQRQGGRNVLYLTLAPEVDAKNAVQEMGRDAVSNPVIIAPHNDKGSRISKAFNDYWMQSYNQNTSVCYFTDVNSLENTLQSCASNAPESFDAAYIYGTANEASIIREYSKNVGFTMPKYYVGSRSNSGVMNNSALMGIKGMKLGDQPWLLENSSIKEQIISILPKANGDTLRCFAVGYDSFNLALHLDKMLNNPEEVVRGLSGDISINHQGRLERNISWITVGEND